MATLGAASCKRELPGDPPPGQALYYPVGLAASPDGHYAYVLSSNFDQRYNSGWLSVVDIDQALADANDAAIGPLLRVPSLGGELVIDAAGGLLVATHRTDRLVSLMHVGGDGGAVSCGDPDAEDGLSILLRRTDCDRPHLVELGPPEGDDEHIGADFADPFALALIDHPLPEGGSVELLTVGYLRSLRLSMFELVREPSGLVQLSNQQTFDLGEGAVNALLVHPDAAQNQLLVGAFVASRNGPDFAAVYGLDVDKLRAGEVQLVSTNLLSELGSVQVRGLAASPDGALCLATTQAPDSLAVLDGRLVTTQIQQNDSLVSVVRPHLSLVGAEPLSGRPSGVTYVPRATGPDLVAVLSFDEDEVFVLTVEGNDIALARRFDAGVGQGPFVARAVHRNGRDLVLFTTFLDHGLTLLDVTDADPNAWTTHRVRDASQPTANEVR